MALTNVLIISAGRPTTPSMIETLRVYGILDEKGLLKMRYVKATTIKKYDVEWCDTALFVRSSSYVEYGLIRLFRKLGKFCIYTIDDDLLSLDCNYGKDGEGYWDGRKKIIKKILRNTDLFLGVNELLAKKYCEIGNIPQYTLTYTIIEHSELFTTRQTGENTEKIRVALYVNDGTTGMFERFIRPVLPMLCSKYPHRIVLYLMALKPNLHEVEGQMEIVYVPHMPYKDFKSYMGTESFDIGLAPLEDEGFSVYKYFNKYVEYSVAGIPAIYSDCRLYRAVIKDGENGLLCKDSKEAWFDAICDMVDHPLKRLRLITNAQKQIYDGFNRDRVLEKLVQDVPQLVSYKAPALQRGIYISLQLVSINIREFFFRIMGWGYTAKQYLKQGKIKPLLKRFETHFIHQ